MVEQENSEDEFADFDLNAEFSDELAPAAAPNMEQSVDSLGRPMPARDQSGKFLPQQSQQQQSQPQRQQPQQQQQRQGHPQRRPQPQQQQPPMTPQMAAASAAPMPQQQAPQAPQARFIPYEMPKRIGLLDRANGKPVIEDDDMLRVIMAQLADLKNDLEEIKSYYR